MEDLKRVLTEKERELRKENTEQGLDLKHLLAQLDEKNKELFDLQSELNEAERIKDTIMGLMNKKRKNT